MATMPAKQEIELVDPNNMPSPNVNRYRVPDIERFFSPNGLTDAMVRVELAHMRALSRRGYYAAEYLDQLEAAAAKVTAQEIFWTEKYDTHHDIRALLKCLKQHLEPAACDWLHTAATSMDLKKTGEIWLWRQAFITQIIPLLKAFEWQLICLARQTADVVQVGRTHLQDAVPITFGFFVAEYVERLGDCIDHLEEFVGELKGKFRGATGSANAMSLIVDDPLVYEREVLADLGLEPVRYCTQILPVEPLVRVMSEVTCVARVLENLADDLRILASSAIAEIILIGEGGSSAMPQKINPTTFEFACNPGRICSGFMVVVRENSISNLQRDQRESASTRMYGEPICYLYKAVEEMLGVFSRMTVNRQALAENLAKPKGAILAEAYTTLLRLHGAKDPDGLMREVAQITRDTGEPFIQCAQNHLGIQPYLADMTPVERGILSDPNLYIGIAPEITRQVCDFWEDQFSLPLPASVT